MARPQNTHWLRENHQERSPHRIMFVDTETAPVDPAQPERQQLRLWCARLERRHGHEPHKPRQERFRGHTAAELAELIDRTATVDSALWVMTHNLNFDLAVTQLPVRLTDRGYRITEAALTTDDPWCRMARGGHRVTVADTWSYLPSSVEAIGELIGLRKLPLPAFGDSESEWWPRCERDVDIIAAAMLQLMDWWDAGRYGNWSLTGPATGWSSYRHRKPVPKVLVNPDPAARDLESRAVTGGRRMVARLGEFPTGLYADLDMATAHLQVMADKRLPARRLRAFDHLELDDPHLSSRITDVLAECEVEVTSPRYPWDSGRGVFYPVGRFRTVLAGPELREAARRGELRSIGRGYVYAMVDHMADWARWVASLLDRANTAVPPAVRLAAKHWSRCVPGKWAGHTSDVIRRIPDPRPGWLVEHGFIHEGHRPADFLLVGGESWTIVRDLWADDAFPAILAWIQAHTRLALGNLLDDLGPAALSANTDGVLVDVNALATAELAATGEPRPSTAELLPWLDAWCAAESGRVAPFTLRVKAACRKLEVISPQHTIVDGHRSLAGIPSRAVSLGNGRYRFTAWPKLRVELRKLQGPGYSTKDTTVSLANVPPAGWLTASGDVEPVQLHLVDGRAEVVTDGAELAQAAGILAPLERQHPMLRRALASLTAQDGPGRAIAP